MKACLIYWHLECPIIHLQLFYKKQWHLYRHIVASGPLRATSLLMWPTVRMCRTPLTWRVRLTCNLATTHSENVSKASRLEGGETWPQLLYLEGLEEEHFWVHLPQVVRLWHHTLNCERMSSGVTMEAKKKSPAVGLAQNKQSFFFICGEWKRIGPTSENTKGRESLSFRHGQLVNEYIFPEITTCFHSCCFGVFFDFLFFFFF